MDMAISEAEVAASEDEVPVGCVIIKDGLVVGVGHNKVEAEKDATLKGLGERNPGPDRKRPRIKESSAQMPCKDDEGFKIRY